MTFGIFKLFIRSPLNYFAFQYFDYDRMKDRTKFDINVFYGDSIIYNDEMIKRKLLSLYQKGHQKVRHKPPSRWSCFIPY
jgi:hypothetical protein